MNNLNRKKLSLILACCSIIASQGTLACRQKPTQKPESKKTNDARASEPYSPVAVEHYNRGVKLHTSGHIDQAASEYTAAVHADSRMKEAWSNLGTIYAQQGSYSLAIKALKRAIAISESYEEPTQRTTSKSRFFDLCRLAAVYSAQRNYPEAESSYKLALDIDEKTVGQAYPDAMDSYAALLRNVGRTAEADALEARARVLRTREN